MKNKIKTQIGVGATLTILVSMKHQLADYKSEMIYGPQLELLDVMQLVLLLK